MAGNFRKIVGNRARSGQDVVRRIDLVSGGRNLEFAPGLVDADVAVDVGRMRAAIGKAGGADRIQSGREIVDRSSVLRARIFEADSSGHAVAELGGVLDVVDAGI